LKTGVGLPTVGSNPTPSAKCHHFLRVATWPSAEFARTCPRVGDWTHERFRNAR
jgi:hypothetical protein